MARSDGHRVTKLFSLSALSLFTAVGASCVNSRSLLREGRLYDACTSITSASPEDEAAVFAEVRRRAPTRVRLHATTEWSNTSGAPMPAIRAGYLVTQTSALAAPSDGSPTITVSASFPSFVAADAASLVDWRFDSQVDGRIAYFLLTGIDRPPPTGSLGGLLLDGTALLLSDGTVDPRLRGEWSVTMHPPPEEHVPVAELLARFNGTDNARWSCDVDAGGSCTRLHALVRRREGQPPARLRMGFSWRIFSGTTACLVSRDAEVPLGPGPDLASRLNAVFANGPLDAFELVAQVR